MMILKSIPVLPMLNTKETIKFYETILGFTAVDSGGYLQMKKEGIRLHFFLCADEYLCANTSCYIIVTNIEDLYIELCAQEMIPLNNKLAGDQWGKKEFSVLDNNGNTLRFVEEK
jgi:hypothetical protein